MLVILLKIFRENFLFLIILITFVFVRLYRLSELTTFGGDQGVDFLTVREMVLYRNWTLIGIKTSIAPFFQGPLYLYILYPFFYFMNLNPISGAMAAVTVSTASIIFFYIMVKRYFSKDIANYASALLTVSPEFVIYGNTPLYQNLQPVFIMGALFVFLTKSKTLSKYTFLGVILGLGLEMHFLNVSLVTSIFALYVFWERVGFKNIAGYIFGVCFGLLPTLVFEFRHNFLNTRLFLDYVSNTEKAGVSISGFFNQWLNGSARFLSGDNVVLGFLTLILAIFYLFSKRQEDSNLKSFNTLALVLFVTLNIMALTFSSFGPEYPLPFWVMMLVIIPAGILNKFSKRVGLCLMFFLILINLTVTLVRLSSRSGYNMPPGLTLNKISQAGKIISEDASEHQNFNVASILDGGTRAYPLRYTVMINGRNPGEVADYPNNNYLYLLAGSDEGKIFESNVWEVQSVKPFKFGARWDLNDNIYLYRLDKILVN